jgi:hypothetical protein
MIVHRLSEGVTYVQLAVQNSNRRWMIDAADLVNIYYIGTYSWSQAWREGGQVRSRAENNESIRILRTASVTCARRQIRA